MTSNNDIAMLHIYMYIHMYVYVFIYIYMYIVQDTYMIIILRIGYEILAQSS